MANKDEKKQTAYIICCNDSIEAVILNDGYGGKSYMEELADKRFSEYSKNMGISYKDTFQRKKDYANSHYWHLHIMEVS